MLVFSIGMLVIFNGIGIGYGQFKPYLEEVPIDIQPVKAFVEQCVIDTAKEGLKVIGAQGGYIDTNKLGIVVTPDPTSSEGVEFVPGVTVPYWYYMKSPNSCVGICIFSQQLTPSTKVIQDQLNDYIKENLQYCTRDFPFFPKFTITSSEPAVESNIGFSNVQVNVLYPLEIDTGSRKTKISKFFSTVSVDLKHILDAARDIAKKELQYQFLEYNDLELIATYSDTHSALLPPFSKSETELKNVFWMTSEVQKKLQALLEEKYMLMQADPALNTVAKKIDDSFAEYMATIKKIYENLIIPFDATSGFNINFHYYSNWPIYLSLNSRAGAVFAEQVMSNMIPGLSLALERYKTIYDVSHPVVIELEDPSALKGEGYTFRFALESNIRGNEPLKHENNPLYGEPAEESMFCDINKRNSGEIHLTVRDSITNNPIPEVNVFFNSVDNCMIGRTDSNGELTAQFPIGIGVINFINPQYLPFTKSEVITELDADQELGVIRMKPLRTIKAKGEIFELNKFGNTHTVNDWIISETSKNIGKNQSVLVTLDRRRATESEQEFKRVFIFDKDNIQQELELGEGEYDVRVMLMYDGNAIIPADRRCIKMPMSGLATIALPILGNKKKCTWINMPGPNPLIMPMPGIEYSTILKVEKNDLESNSIFTFYGLFVNMPAAQGLKIEDLQVLDNLANRYKTNMEPKKW